MNPISESWEQWVSRYRNRAINPQPERTYRCVPCLDTGFELTRKLGPFGTLVSVGVVCTCTEGQARQAAHIRRQADAAAGPRRPTRRRIDPDEPDGRYGHAD